VDKQFEPLSEGEVLSVNDSAKFLIGHGTFRVGELADALRQQLLEKSIGGLTDTTQDWFTEDGIQCEALRFGATGWEKGKVRIHIEFCPSNGAAPEITPSPQAAKAAAPETTPSSADQTASETLGAATAMAAEELIETPAPETVVEEEAADDVFGESESTPEAEADDLFGGEEEDTSDDLFGESESTPEAEADDLFGGEEEDAADDVFGESESTPEAEADDLFGGEEEDTSDDLFGGEEEDTSDDSVWRWRRRYCR